MPMRRDRVGEAVRRGLRMWTHWRHSEEEWLLRVDCMVQEVNGLVTDQIC